MRNKYFILVLTFLSLLIGQSSYAQDWQDMWDATEDGTNSHWESNDDGGFTETDFDYGNLEHYETNMDDQEYNDWLAGGGWEDQKDHSQDDMKDPHNQTNDHYVDNIRYNDDDDTHIYDGLLDTHNYDNDTNPYDDDQYPPGDTPNNDDTGTPDTIPEKCSLVGCTTPGTIVDQKLCECVPTPTWWYYDNDGDKYYSSAILSTGSPGPKFSTKTNGEDCDDNDVNNHNNCAGFIWYLDADGDEYHSDTFEGYENPGKDWISTTKGVDCDENIYSQENNCDNDVPCKTSKEDLKLLFPNLTDQKATLLANTLNKFSKSYGIETKEMLQHFLAQAGHESNNFKTFGEYTNHQPKNIMSGPFSDYFNNFGKEGKDPQKSDISSIHTTGAKYVDGEKYLNIIYDDRNPNRINKIGNIYDGDGYKFRGRGALQITGRDNYTNFTTFYNSVSNSTKDFTKTPDDLKNDFEISIHASLWYFQKFVLQGIKNFQAKAINPDLKAQDKLITRVSNIVNGGDNGLADRKTKLQDAKTKIKCN